MLTKQQFADFNMDALPPQPQVNFVVCQNGKLCDAIGQLAWEDGEAYAIPSLPLGSRFVIRLEKDQLERRIGVLGLPYFVHHGQPIRV